MKIKIRVGKTTLEGELYDNESAKQVASILPLNRPYSTWGDEIYFEIPLDMKANPDAQIAVEVGDLAYWPPGKAFCIFYGPTPASDDEKPLAASAVNIIGKVHGDCSVLKKVSADTISVEKVEE